MVKIFDRDGRGAGPLSASECAALAAIFLLALALRLVPTVFYPTLSSADELFQSLEQAHRAAFGYGEIPWEFHVGTRSWILPGALAGFMWLGDRIADTPALYLGAAHLALAALAATSVLCAFFWGRRWFGVWGGLVAASLPALWPDLVYFGARSLSECVAAPLLVLGLYFLDDEAKRATSRRLQAAGFFLGLATALRIQLAPVLALALAWRAVEFLRRRTTVSAELPLLGGVALALGMAGLVDALTWRYPFQSLWLNFDYNIIYGVAATFGTEPWSFYLIGLIAHWGWGFPVIFVLAALGGWRLQLPLLAAVVIIATHSVIGHKEYRFIYPALLLILISGGMGLAQIASWLGARTAGSPRRIAVASLAGATMFSAVFAASAEMRPLWGSFHGLVEVASVVSRLDHVCGIGADGTYGGYAYFHRKVPFYWLRDGEDMARYAPGFNVLLTRAAPPPEFKTVRCFGDICLAQREGSCAPIPPSPMFRSTPVTSSGSPG
jgi:hypothetical protein